MKIRIRVLSIRKCSNIILMLFIALFSMLTAAACSPFREENKTANITGDEKSILEQAVDWGNDNLFDEKKEYDIFTLQSKDSQGKEYNFLLKQEDGVWGCELYYVQCDNENHVRKITPCGGGNNALFSYDIVNLSGENYAAVYCASHMGNGDLELFPLDNANSNIYTIDNVIDRHHEDMALVDVDGNKYTKSLVYCEDKLTAVYTDVNQDGFTDIVLSGIILQYENYIGDSDASDKLTDSQNCKRTYLYNSSAKQFELSEEILESINKKVYLTDPVQVEVGTEFTSDLNGDNTEDTVYYGTQMIQENGYSYEMPFLTINGMEFNYRYLEEEFGVYIVDCSKIGYYILDLDTSDSYREIAILDEGPSSDMVTYFFRYTGKELIYCGAVTDFPGNLSFYAPGDGSIRAEKRLDILQTWWSDATWKLNEKDVLEEQISDIYYPYQYKADDSRTNYAMKDLTLFLKPDKRSASVIVKKGEVIQLTATDNLNWVEITSESGTKGWFYLHDGYEVTLPTGEVKIGDIVTYLNMAD